MPHPDLVLLNARLLDPGLGDLLAHSALAAAGGVITVLGDDRSVRELAGPGTTVVDLGGAVVMPGFVDGHIHPVYGVERTLGVDFSDCADIESVRERIAAEVVKLEHGAWFKGWGLDPNAFGEQPVSAAALGAVLEGVPALIDLFDAHSALASPAALAAAGIDGPREFAQASEIVCDADGVPTGLLLEEAACSLVEAVAPRPTEARLRAQTVKVLGEMAAAGLTGGHAMDGEPDTLAAVASLAAEGLLPLRFRFAPWCQPGADANGVAELIRQQGQGGRLWRVDGVKLFMDGTIDNGTAWLERPDCHGESTHAFWPDPAAYTEVIGELHRAGVPTATHAIGDAAVRHALDAIELAQGPAATSPVAVPTSAVGSPAATGHAPAAAGADVRRPRHRIEHIETVPDDTIPRFATLGVVASMQPTHCCDYTRADHTDNWSQRLGEPRASRGWRIADLWDAGATVVLGSDWPIAPYPPLTVMAGARHRRPTRDLGRPPHGPAQALSALRALRGYTLNPAYAAGEEHVAGRLAEGFRADLTVLAENPLAVPDLELADVRVVLTVVAGAVTHRASEV